jgi:hypothetical protein
MQKYARIMQIILCGWIIFLYGCSLSPHEDTRRAQYDLTCVKQCKIKSAACHHNCTDSCKLCEQQEKKAMKARYKTYLHEQCVQGERAALQLQSFRDPLQCRKISCDCPADYRTCVGACKGSIRKYLQVTPFCC